jgi:hypothetical protein
MANTPSPSELRPVHPTPEPPEVPGTDESLNIPPATPDQPFGMPERMPEEVPFPPVPPEPRD